jgi:hypothetical protein
MKWLLLFGLALCTGCMPMVQHGPWIYSGPSGAVGAAGGAVAEVSTNAWDAGPLFDFGAGLRVGIPFNDSTHQGVSLGARLPLIGFLALDGSNADGIFQVINFDGYVTGPRLGELHTAAGVTLSGYHYMPYVQLGRFEKRYGTVALMRVRDLDLTVLSYGVTWVRHAGEQTLSHVTLLGGYAGRWQNSEDMAFVAIGINFEFIRKNARTGS